jgi:hypothetical protein
MDSRGSTFFDSGRSVGYRLHIWSSPCRVETSPYSRLLFPLPPQNALYISTTAPSLQASTIFVVATLQGYTIPFGLVLFVSHL